MLVNTKNVVQEIAKEAAMLAPSEQELLLKRLKAKRQKKKGTRLLPKRLTEQQRLIKKRLAKYLETCQPPIADYDSKKIKPPTMEQIDKWKHESRIKK